MGSKTYTVELTLLDEGDKRKARAREKAREKRRKLLALSRKIAVECARRHPLGICWIDVVYKKLALRGHDPCDLGGAAGSLFRGGEWEATCLRVRSRRRASHAREIKVWRLKGAKRRGGRGSARVRRQLDRMARQLVADGLFGSNGLRKSTDDLVFAILWERASSSLERKKRAARGGRNGRRAAQW